MAESVARQRINWRVLGVEAAAIFLSVLLGFGVTEWRENRSEAERRDALLQAFFFEVDANRDNLIERGRYHHWLVEQIDAGIQAGDLGQLSDVFQIDRMTGFNPLSLKRAAWATATATGDIALLDFDTASALWSLYDSQAAIDTEQIRLRTMALNEISNPDPILLQRFSFTIYEFADLERELLFQLHRAEVHLSIALGDSPPQDPSVDILREDPFGADSVATPDASP